MSDWKINKGPVSLDEIEARVIDMRDVRNRGMFPTLVHRKRTHYITDVLPSFEGKHRLVTIDGEWRSKLFDVSDPLVTETIPARTYFKMLLNSIYGKNYFCVMIEGGNGNFYEATGVEVKDNNAQVLVAPNDDGVEKIIFTNIDTLSFEYTTTPDGKRGYYRHIRKGNPMPETELAPIDFQDFYIKETFDHLKETVVLYDEQFYTVLGMRTNLAKPGNYSLYLMRRAFNTVRKVEITPNQKFIHQKNSNSWLVDPVEALYTDFAEVKEQLRAEGVKKVIVAGVEKELKRVSEISSGLLHLVFAYDGELEHFYSTKNTRLRVREGKITTEYLLDHVKRMHV